MSSPVAIITGAASGIGQAATRHLLEKGLKVVMADINREVGERLSHELGENTFFVQTDVSSYEQQAALFKRAFEWGGNRVDVFAANAGIDDAQSLYETTLTRTMGYQDDDEAGGSQSGLDTTPPQPLDLKTIDVDLTAVIQGIWLFAHYVRLKPSTSSPSIPPGGKVIITSSAAGIYPMFTNPLYTAAKHALVGLTRAAGPVMYERYSITVNCFMPAFVVTNMCPPHMRDKFPKEHITPMETIMRAYDTFLDEKGGTGRTLEASLDTLGERKPPEDLNESQRWMREESAQFWERAYKL